MAKKKRPSNSARPRTRRTATASTRRDSLKEAGRVLQWREYVSAWKLGQALHALEYAAPRAELLGLSDWTRRAIQALADMVSAVNGLGLSDEHRNSLIESTEKLRSDWEEWLRSEAHYEEWESFRHGLQRIEEFPSLRNNWAVQIDRCTWHARNLCSQIEQLYSQVRLKLSLEAYDYFRMARQLMRGTQVSEIPSSWEGIEAVWDLHRPELHVLDPEVQPTSFGGMSSNSAEEEPTPLTDMLIFVLTKPNAPTQDWYRHSAEMWNDIGLAPEWPQWDRQWAVDNNEPIRFIDICEGHFVTMLGLRHPALPVVVLYDEPPSISINGGNPEPLDPQCFKILEILLALPQGETLKGDVIYRRGAPTIRDQNISRLINNKMPESVKALMPPPKNGGFCILAIRGE